MRALFLLFVLSVQLVRAPAGPVRVISAVGTHARVVALTFDAGADRGYAARILTTLERDRVHATFGMTGLWAKANRDLVRRMARDGDALINHTYDHRSFTGYSTKTAPLTRAQRVWEIVQGDKTIQAAIGRSARPYFRPPYGDYDTATLTLLRQMGYRYMIMWTVDSLGWDALPRAAILQRCLSLLRPGDIFLMHVGSQSQDALALPAFIAALKRERYHMVTIPQLVAGH